MTKLPMPVVCECGFNTMDAQAAINHIRDKHPEEWTDYPEWEKGQGDENNLGC